MLKYENKLSPISVEIKSHSPQVIVSISVSLYPW